MFKLGKDELLKFLREDLPVMGVDLIIGSVKLATEMSDKAARLIVDGTIPAPGFIIDKAREKVESREDIYRVAEPEHGWDKPDFLEEVKKAQKAEAAPPAVKKAGKSGKKKKKTKKAAQVKPDADKPKKKRKRTPKKKKEVPEEPQP